MKKEFEAKNNGELIKLCLEEFPKLNFNQLKTALRKKDIKVNMVRTNKNIDVSVGDKIEIFLPNEKTREVKFVYQDSFVAVAIKPQGVETTLADKMFDSECLEEMTGYKACHRLDKNTEGLVVMAKNDIAYNELLKAFKNSQVHKKYLCVVSGNPKPSANLNAYLVKDPQKSIVKIFNSKQDNSCLIKTNYTLVERQGELSMLKVELLTGKTHQIRAHLAHEHLKILGDEKYGDKDLNRKYGIKKQLLCAYSLNFNLEKSSFLAYLNDKNFNISPSFSLSEIESRKKSKKEKVEKK